MKQKLNRENLTLNEVRLINYLIGKRGIGKNGFCYAGTSYRYSAVKALQQKAVIKIISLRGNIINFCFTKRFQNQTKI